MGFWGFECPIPTVKGYVLILILYHNVISSSVSFFLSFFLSFLSFFLSFFLVLSDTSHLTDRFWRNDLYNLYFFVFSTYFAISLR